jgi:ubiquinone/menaquinone biosynthesis C-methylase UbiE
MLHAGVAFDDADSYERFMGRWSRMIGGSVLEWMVPSSRADWLDVGCGTGVLTKLVLKTCNPGRIVAVDPAPAQIAYATAQPMAQRVQFGIASAERLPFPAQSFDIVVSALVLNFVRDTVGALMEMSRVCRRGGTVATYVWDFASGRSMAWPFSQALRHVGIECPLYPGENESSAEALGELFARAGLQEIVTRTFEETLVFRSFDVFWQSQAPAFSTHGKLIAAQSDTVRDKILGALRTALPVNSNGTLAVAARAGAAKAKVGQ